MNKSIKIYVAILVLLFVGIIAVEMSRPKPIDWRPTYNETHKIPFGTFIFFNEINELFNEDVKALAQTPYEYFSNLYDWQTGDYEIEGTYMYVDQSLTIDDISAQELLDFAYVGNTVFISSSSVPSYMMDSLKLETRYGYSVKGDAVFTFANRRLKNDSIKYDRGRSNVYFHELDSTTTTVLGYQKFEEEDKINFVKIAHGEGEVLLHLQPVVFTNYSLLKNNNAKYAEAVLRYIPDGTIYFDSRNKKREQLSSNVLRFIFSQPTLKWAWLTAIFSLIVFVIFNAKRKQRIVRVIPPVENTTVAFTKTIGNLYYETKDHQNLIDKKITYFLEYLRRVYYIDTEFLNESFTKKLAQKTGQDKDFIHRLVKLIVNLRAKSEPQESDLITLNKTLEKFFNS
ncbi:MAG: DUF4350 domain-containing protein [bacterium]